ncbi:MAG: hypothetical protein ACRDP3_12050 [Streptomyces sp.]|uniref:hypothetical protein n=1 Tax=Streptomyces sp. TaxID=1931 RepID=UPI003D6C0989
MGTATIQVRVLAVAGRRVWVAARGTLGGPTVRVLHYCLCARVADARTQLYLDLRELCWDKELSPGELSGLLPAGERLRFHIVGVREALRAPMARDPRCSFHPDAASAWAAWTAQQP